MDDTTAHDAPRRTRDLLAFDRADRADRADRVGLVLLLWVSGILAATTWLLVPILSWAGGDDLLVPFFSEVSVPALDAVGVRYDEAEYLLHVADATAGQWLPHLLPGFGFTVVVVAGAALLAPVVRDVGRDDPFTARNVRRLRVLGLLMVLAWPALTVAARAVDAAVLAQLDLRELGARFTFGLPFGVMIAGMVVGLVAEAFAAGARLRDDVDGLV